MTISQSSHHQTTMAWHLQDRLLPHPFDFPLLLVGDILVSLHLLNEALHRLIGKSIVIYVEGVICHHITPVLGGESCYMFSSNESHRISHTLFEIFLCSLLVN